MMRPAVSLLFGICFLWPQKPDIPFRSLFILNNVGQGQWAIYIDSQYCIHVDLGGEFYPKGKVLNLCKSRKNILLFSHLDYDHINLGLRFFKNNSSGTCGIFPNYQVPKKSLPKRIFKTIPKCRHIKKFPLQILRPPTSAKTENQKSQIVILGNQFLVTGDTTKPMERLWLSRIKNPKRIQIVTVPHHGSATSSSKKLITTFRHALFTVSARRKKYGHPSEKTKKGYRKFGIPLLTTEVYGNIIYYGW